MASLRDVKRRIRSAQNTRKITRAQQVVAATKLRRAQQAVQETRPYAEKMLEVLETTAELATEYRHPYLEQRPGKRAVMLVITADRGLCGALNTNTLRAVNRHVNREFDGQARYVTIGRRGRDFLMRYGRDVIADVSQLKDRPPIAEILPAVAAALQEFDEGRADTVVLAYAKWVSTLRQEPVIRPLVPVEIPEGQAHPQGADYIYEPDPEDVLDQLLPRYIETQVYQALLENQASEQSARMIAMQNATNAADDFIKALSLTANKLRQESITTELMDIVGGAEAVRAS
jgi:F-type H+-transporting ATPase subunit gamma